MSVARVGREARGVHRPCMGPVAVRGERATGATRATYRLPPRNARTPSSASPLKSSVAAAPSARCARCPLGRRARCPRAPPPRRITAGRRRARRVGHLGDGGRGAEGGCERREERDSGAWVSRPRGHARTLVDQRRTERLPRRALHPSRSGVLRTRLRHAATPSIVAPWTSVVSSRSRCSSRSPAVARARPRRPPSSPATSRPSPSTRAPPLPVMPRPTSRPMSVPTPRSRGRCPPPSR